jgi:hypothetical protein
MSDLKTNINTCIYCMTNVRHLKINFNKTTSKRRGHAVAQLVEALLYKPEGRGFAIH